MIKYHNKIRALTSPLLCPREITGVSVSTWVQLQVRAGRADSLLQGGEREVALLSEAVLVMVLLVVREPGGLAGPQSAVIVSQASRPHSPPSQRVRAESQQETS